MAEMLLHCGALMICAYSDCGSLYWIKSELVWEKKNVRRDTGSSYLKYFGKCMIFHYLHCTVEDSKVLCC